MVGTVREGCTFFITTKEDKNMVKNKNYSEEFLYTKEDKERYLYKGPWLDEPDKVSFEHSGMKCLVIRSIIESPESILWFGGHLCGYVVLPEYHPLYECKYYPDFEVHGDITFNDSLNEHAFALGFDCGHMNDMIPSMKKVYEEICDNIKRYFPDIPNRYSPSQFLSRTYRDMPYVIQECKNLADQLSTYKK